MLRIAAAPLGGRCGQGVPREVTEVERPEEALDDEPATGRDGQPTDGQDDRPRAPHPVGARLRRLGVKLALAGLSVVLTLGVVEVVFRLLGYRPVYSVYSKPDEFFRADPELGWSFAPDTQGTYVGPRPFPVEFRTDVRINSLGLRGPEIEPVPDGGLRVLVLGDSWVAGLEVPEDRTYSALLQDELTDRLGVPVQVINAGVRGYGTDQSWLLYRERLRDLEPDLVVHHTTGNDPEDNTVVHRMHRAFSKPAFVLEGDGGLRRVGHPVDDRPQCSEYRVVDGDVRRIDGRRARALCRVQTRLSDHSAFFSFITERIQGNPALVRRLYGLSFPDEHRPPGSDGEAPARAPTPAPKPDADGPSAPAPPPEAAPEPRPALDHPHLLTSVLIRELADDVRDAGAAFVLVGVRPDLGALDLPAFEADGIPTIRLDPALDDPGKLLVPNDGHPNERGHQRIADLLADELLPHLEGLVR